MTIKTAKKRTSNGISTLHGNKRMKGFGKEHSSEKNQSSHTNPPNPASSNNSSINGTLEPKVAKVSKNSPVNKSKEKKQENQGAPLVIMVSRHEYPALKSVFGNSAFYTADGRELRNLLDMALAFEEMSEDTFRHHVGVGYNHFSNWLKDCFQLEHLAESIKSSDRKEAHTKVLRHLLHEVLK